MQTQFPARIPAGCAQLQLYVPHIMPQLLLLLLLQQAALIDLSIVTSLASI